MTRRIGRRLREASPIIVVVNGCAASTPAIIRIVDPELPASSGPSGAASPRMPRPEIRMRSPAPSTGVAVTAVPSARRHDSVDRQSAPGA